MDIKRYEIMLNALDRGSFVKVCEELGYTQSGITHMMNSLERDVGFPLLRRSNKGVQVTEEGAFVLPTIRELVRLNEKLEQMFDQVRNVERGKVRIGSYPTIACAWIPRIIHRLREEYPNIEVEVQEENSVIRLQKYLREGLVDLCFMSKTVTMTGDWLPISQDPYQVLLPKEHPLAQKKEIHAGELMDDTFLICKSTDGFDPDITQYFSAHHVPIQSGYSCNSDNTIVYMVEQGLGVSMLPKLFLDMAVGEEMRKRVAIRSLNPAGYRELGFAVQSMDRLSPAMERFIQCTREELM